MSKISLFKDKPDLIVKITNDNITNVTGSVGSGKSTYGRKYRDNKDYIVIGLDSLYDDNDPNTLNDDIKELRKILIKKYKKLEKEEMLYYNDMIEFILSKNKKGIIEGGHLMHMKNISDFKGTVIVKRTARIKCYLRASLRDYRNPVWRKGLNKWGLIKRFFHCYKRRFHHIFKQNYVEQFIIKLEEYSKKMKGDSK